jgi:hypothetical protein
MSIKAIEWAFRQKLSDPTAKLVLIGIADKYNEDRGYAWPSVERLADMADCTRRTVSRKIAMLEEMKLVATVRSPSQTNQYYLPTMTSCHHDTGVMGVMTSDVMGVMTPDVPQTVINDSEQKDSIKSAFEDFWGAVPKKVGKKAALEAFKVARKNVDADTLKQGIVRYAKKVKADGTPARFIVHPTTWLQQGRWDDDLTEEATSLKPPVGSRNWLPESKEEFEREIMQNEMMRNRTLQYVPHLWHYVLKKGWIDERPKPTHTYG